MRSSKDFYPRKSALSASSAFKKAFDFRHLSAKLGKKAKQPLFFQRFLPKRTYLCIVKTTRKLQSIISITYFCKMKKAIRFIIISICTLICLAIPTIIIYLTISGPREANFNRYNVQTIAYVDTIRQGGQGRQGRHSSDRWTHTLSYIVGGESYSRPIEIRSRTPLPKGTLVPIRYSQNNPTRVVVHLHYPIPLNDSIELYFTRHRLGGIHYILRRRE